MARKGKKKAKKGQQKPAAADSVEAKKGQQEPAAAASVEAKKGQQKPAKAAKKRRQQWHEAPVVSESTRILTSKILEEFRDSPEEVYTFEAGISKRDRATIHELCRKMGMHSRSRGGGGNRRLSVYKRLPKQGMVEKGKDVSTRLRFSDETTMILQDLFSEFPPGDNELSGYAPTNSDTKNVKQPASQNDCFLRPLMSKAEISSKLETLASKVADTENLRKVSKDRANLPIASFRNDINSAIESHQVVLISGETGCGKTTQVPQYILDLMWDRGKTCKIICTQPRRISAISVAERISYERGENVGDTIGYKIRLESKGGRHSSIMFCTNGILLRILVERGSDKSCGAKKFKDTLSEITHVIVDEIHERDRFSDFMLAILRENLAALPHLRLVLMSATMDAQRFSEYFSGCPIIRVPGFTYPVKCLYLEDVLSMLQSAEGNHLDTMSSKGAEEPSMLSDEQKTSLDECIELASSSDEISPLLEMVFTEPLPEIFNYQHSFTGVSPLMVVAGKGRVNEACMLLSLGADCSLTDNDGNTVLDWAQREQQADILEIVKEHIKDNQSGQDHLLIDKYLATINPEHIDIGLIERLLYRISVDSKEGAVLVFLPGWDDINRTREKLLSSPYFLDSSKFVILSLHSMVPSVEQKKVFKRVPAGMRKIILSTNIAETAVTIDDVVYVIDSGRMKERNYDPFNNVSTLYASWISKANAKQREGRAGRCQPGICYHLYSKARAASLPDHQVPEIKRMPIEELCLQVKLLNSDHNIANFLLKTLDPPLLESIDNAIAVLQDIGALNSSGNLTKLGEKLGALPVHPSTGKMLLFGILMNCLDPALTMACASDFRDPFVLPMNPEERKRAADAKVELSSLYGGYSDHLTVIAAFDCWRRAKDKGQDKLFCSKYFVSSGTMHMLFGMCKQLQNEMVRSGIIPKDASNCSLNAKDLGIVRAVLMAGTYPSVGRMWRQGNKKCVLETASGAKAGIHPHSSNFKLSFNKAVGGLLFVYNEVTRGEGRLYVKDCSAVGPYPLLLLAKELVVAPASSNANNDKTYETSGSDEAEDIIPMSDEKQGEEIMSSPENNVSVIVDRWLSFKLTALDAAMIYCLRERLDSAIMFKVEHPKEVLPPVLGASVYAMACILSYDGMFGISPPLEPVVSAANSAVGKASGQSSSSSASLLSSLFSSSKHVRPHMNANMVQYGNDFARKAAPSGARPTGSYSRNPSKRHRGSD